MSWVGLWVSSGFKKHVSFSFGECGLFCFFFRSKQFVVVSVNRFCISRVVRSGHRLILYKHLLFPPSFLRVGHALLRNAPMNSPKAEASALVLVLLRYTETHQVV